jgi:hypothetical protein
MSRPGGGRPAWTAKILIIAEGEPMLAWFAEDGAIEDQQY